MGKRHGGSENGLGDARNGTGDEECVRVKVMREGRDEQMESEIVMQIRYCVRRGSNGRVGESKWMGEEKMMEGDEGGWMGKEKLMKGRKGRRWEGGGCARERGCGAEDAVIDRPLTCSLTRGFALKVNNVVKRKTLPSNSSNALPLKILIFFFCFQQYNDIFFDSLKSFLTFFQ